ncbi:hypothetical protein A5N78_11060 [Prescottella equi]|uniref:hypothetical protein n=1 Tax=Rhodococcus hoagii TaxID=43767 RepID=UPI000A0FB3F9|nr:hypothetical protein [Prescottella equi]ORL90140.1 hypothetical protein A5N78_11060 [Prescottella equi]ORM19216.1 hypothetical protein A5N70_09475 [Prescottella equi]
MGDDNEAGASRAVAAWTFGLSLVSVVAVGVVVAGFLHSPEPELTTALPTTTPPTTEPERPEYSYVTPSVTYPTQIPGCDVVERPGESEWTAFVVDRDSGYDNPDYPWFSGPKAGAMSRALRDALPGGVEVAFASPERSLIFQPIMSEDAPEDGAPDYDGNTNADVTLSRDGKNGSLSVAVRLSTDAIPACVAGYLDARRTLADGTVVDVLDTWSETNGVRTLSRSASAYAPDGTRVSAYSTDAAVADSGQANSGTVPLTVDELVVLVTAPGLRVTAPVPPGSATPPASCSSPVEQRSGPEIDRATAERFGTMLAAVPLDGLTLDRPLGALQPARLGGDAVCQSVRVTTPGRESTLDVAIAGGQELPSTDAPPEASSERSRTTVRQLPDGSVVEQSEHDYTSMGLHPGSETRATTQRVVTVTRPSGTLVRASSEADSPSVPVSFEQLDAIALVPGIEVPR